MEPETKAIPAPPDPKDSPFTGSDVAIVLLASIILPLIVASFVTDVGNPFSVFVVLLPSQWLGNAIGLMIVARRRRASEADFGLPIVGRDYGGLGLGALIFLAIVTVLGPLATSLELDGSGQVTLDAFSSIATPWVLAVAVINITVLAPLMEEMTYRGVLHGALRKRLGPIVTVVVGAVIFASAHVPGVDPATDKYALVLGFTLLEVFLLSLLLHGLRERDGRIGRAFFAHAAWNAVNLLAILSLPYLES